MADTTFLDWPFFEERHRTFVKELRAWAECEVPPIVANGHIANEHKTSVQHGSDSKPALSLDNTCQTLVRKLGQAGWLRCVVPKAYGGLYDNFDVRTLCLVRETLASISGLADFSFAMQGLGSGPIALFGSDSLKQRYLPKIATGETIGAFAISEAEAGSDVAAMTTTARVDGDSYVINGEKTWISNAGIATHYVVFCALERDNNSDDNANAKAKKEFIAIVVDADTKGLSVSNRIDVIAPHPLGTLKFENCRVNASNVIGEAGKGLKIALGTLDVFRTTVGAASLGFARRAMDEALTFASQRSISGQYLSDFQLTRARLATMATDIDTSALLIYRAAWTRDTGSPRITREAAMAKWHATEAAQRVIDSAVQLLGGRGVVSGAITEELYREIRALRIYEGTSEIQQLIIAGQLLTDVTKTDSIRSE